MAVTATDPFDRLYRRYARDVYRFALTLVRNPTEAEDVTQTAFLNAYRAYTRGERPERPHSWLIAIAHNAIRSRGRRRLRRPAEVPLERAAELASPPTERSEAVDVLRALGDLPAAQRDALAMRELEGRSYLEIASVLGVSVEAVESLVARGRRTLRRHRELLRGLLLLPFRHGEEAGTGFAAKAAAAVAAAGLAVGGIGAGSQIAGHHQAPLPRTKPASAPVTPPVVGAAVAVPASHVHAATPRSASPKPVPAPAPRRPAAPSGPPAPPPPPAAPAPAAGVPAAAPASTAAAPAPATTASAAAVQPAETTTATATTTVAAATTALPVPPLPPVTTPSVTVETPVATVTVPAVTVTVPVPGVPQVSGLPGIN